MLINSAIAEFCYMFFAKEPNILQPLGGKGCTKPPGAEKAGAFSLAGKWAKPSSSSAYGGLVKHTFARHLASGAQTSVFQMPGPVGSRRSSIYLKQ